MEINTHGAFKLGLQKITYIQNSSSRAPLAATMIDTHAHTHVCYETLPATVWAHQTEFWPRNTHFLSTPLIACSAGVFRVFTNIRK